MEGSKRQQTLDLRRGSEKNSFQVFAFQAPDVSLTNTSYFLLVLSRFSKILVDLTLSCALLPQSGVFYNSSRYVDANGNTEPYCWFERTHTYSLSLLCVPTATRRII